MNDLLGKRLETYVNIAIIVAALAFISLLSYRLLQTAESFSDAEVKIGQNFRLTEVNWAENKKTLVLVLQENCSFCNESMNFYKKIVEKNKKDNPIKLIAVFPTSNQTAKAHLKKQEVEISEVRQINSETFQISKTPTLVLVNERGEIIDSWAGKLMPEDEEKVLQRIL